MTRGRKPSNPKVRDLAEGRLQVLEGGRGGGDGGKPPGRNPPPPKWLTDRVAQEAWRKLVAEMIRRKQYLHLFEIELGRYCNAFADYVKARREIKKAGASGMVIKTPNGYPIQSPWVVMMNRANEIMVRLAADLGFNPVAQNRLDGLQLDLFDQSGPAPGGNDPGEDEATGFRRFRS